MTEILSIEGQESASIYAPTTQVYKATHDRDGNRLPYRYRSFISFSYGEKMIEDFGLIATTDGDRLNRSIYAKFNDVTETHETLDGQIYWGTYLTNNVLKLNLSTDGITAKQLDDFKQWFAPGKVRELILMEHPNRAIMARVSEPPQFSMLPFETKANAKILGQNFVTEVTLFKGDISLSFVMDEPYWYAKNNIIYPFMVKGGANGIINLKDDPYVLKDLLEREFKAKNKNVYVEYIENNVTHIDSAQVKEINVEEYGYWELTCDIYRGNNIKEIVLAYPARKEETNLPIIISLYGGSLTTLTELEGGYSDVDIDAAKDFAKIIYEDNIPHLQMIQDNILLGENIGATSDAESRVYNNTTVTIDNLLPNTGAHVTYYGYVAYDIVSWIETVEISKGHPQYLFYSATFDANSGYVNLPRNSYSHTDIANTRNYNYIAFDEHKFYFTTPSLITGYNQAINIVKNYESGQSFEELITLLKEKINEYYARAWAIFCVKSLQNNNINVPTNFSSNFIERMKYLICENGTTPNSITCFFDSKHGTSTVTFKIREANINPKNVTIQSIREISSVFKEQNAGDMVKSDYLIIEGRNYPSFNGYISKNECHILKTDFLESNPLTNLLVTFQNMYY